MKKCPYCDENIQDGAEKCRYCGEWIKKIRKVPELKIPPQATKELAEMLYRAHNLVKDVIENYDGDGEPDYHTLMHSAMIDVQKICQEEIALIRKILYDDNNEVIVERWNIRRLNENPKIRKIIEIHFPEIIQKIEAIEMTLKICKEDPDLALKIRENPDIYKYNYDGEIIKVRENGKLIKNF